jgi:hypothetical protein
VLIVTVAAMATIQLAQPLPGVVRQGDHVVVAGRARTVARPAEIALEAKRTGRWRVLATARVRGRGRFHLEWDVAATAATGPLSLRIVARRRAGAVVAATKPTQSYVGPGPILCAPPVPPAVDIPVGDGWIVGGRYNVGGAFPGVTVCDSQAYTVIVTSAAGQVVLTEPVAGGQSYTLAPLPAGSYALKSDFCTGTATVTAGKQTMADTVCPVP